jgi:formylglycine-generating enzyme
MTCLRGDAAGTERTAGIDIYRAKGSDGMKTGKWIITMMVMAAGVGYGQGSKLTPPGPPGETMHTLTEIFDVVDGLQQQVADMQQQLNTIKQRQGAAGFAETVGGMVLIPAGPFQMGDAFTEGGSDERPVHEVTVSAFYMDQYEVTKALWDEVRTWANDEGLGYTDLPTGEGKGPSHPVHTVNWHNCVQWANARSQRDGLTPVYYTTAAFTTVYKTGTGTPYPNWSANGYRLPTEAEWERAARSGVEGRRFPWANGNTVTHSLANYESGSSDSYDVNPTSGFHPSFDTGSMPYTSHVGAFAPNGYGLYDMAGNVAEWCWDWYQDTYYSSSPSSDPKGPAGGERRIIRGGEWFSGAYYIRCSNRSHAKMDYVYMVIGFRCVRAL